jgi:hypothetical protein
LEVAEVDGRKHRAEDGQGGQHGGGGHNAPTRYAVHGWGSVLLLQGTVDAKATAGANSAK